MGIGKRCKNLDEFLRDLADSTKGKKSNFSFAVKVITRNYYNRITILRNVSLRQLNVARHGNVNSIQNRSTVTVTKSQQ